MKHLRYYAEFYDVEGVLYRVEIHQESEVAYTPQEVVLAADPVMIEWPEVSKIDPLQGSGATLRLVSMTDRQFVDLYSVEPKTIRMDIYRAGSLYWSGTLDTELYQEPYSFKERYVTEITFSDFGVLDRLLWEQHDWMTVGEVVNHCVEATGILYTAIDKYVATTVPTMPGNILTDCTISADNFYDEDGEAWSIKEVLEEVLRPFALQIRQKNGKVTIADTHSLSAIAPQSIEWRASDSQLGVEPVYNKAIVTFSPFSETELFNGNMDADKILSNPDTPGVTTLFVPLPETDYNGFKIYLGPSIQSPIVEQGLTIGGNARLFRIDPDNNGSIATGVAWGVKGPLSEWIGNAPQEAIIETDSLGTMIMQTPKMPVQRGSVYQKIQISLDVLFDPRINPFAEAGNDNKKAEWEEFREDVNFFAIPCRVAFYTLDGKVFTYDTTNRWKNLRGGPYESFEKVEKKYPGEWIEGDGGRVAISYYSESDRENDTGLNGWSTNKQNIGQWHWDGLPLSATLNNAGEKIPMPDKIGFLQVTVFAGAAYVNVAREFENGFVEISNLLRWQLYKDLRVEVVSYSGGAIELEDVVVSAWLNPAAKEETSIDTYLGSETIRTPMARGAILRSDTSEAIRSFTRAGVTDSLERLLVGTVYSNYATRKNTLTGTIRLLPESLVLSDKSDVNGRYVILSANENLQQAISEVKIAEFSADEYSGIEYE